jgi:hypothetical protein
VAGWAFGMVAMPMWAIQPRSRFGSATIWPRNHGVSDRVGDLVGAAVQVRDGGGRGGRGCGSA